MTAADDAGSARHADLQQAAVDDARSRAGGDEKFARKTHEKTTTTRRRKTQTRKSEAQLRHAVLRAYLEAMEQAKPQQVERILPCPRCRDTRARVVDEKSGDVTCVQCGCSGFAWERNEREAPFGTGAGQYSEGSTRESYELDRVLRERAHKGGLTTRLHKNRLARRARVDLDALCEEDRTADIAARMFEAYSEPLERLCGFSSVVQACADAASTLLRRRALNHEGKPPPTFSCEKCRRAFSCKKDVRLHRCKPAPGLGLVGSKPTSVGAPSAKASISSRKPAARPGQDVKNPASDPWPPSPLPAEVQSPTGTDMVSSVTGEEDEDRFNALQQKQQQQQVPSSANCAPAALSSASSSDDASGSAMSSAGRDPLLAAAPGSLKRKLLQASPEQTGCPGSSPAETCGSSALPLTAASAAAAAAAASTKARTAKRKGRSSKAKKLRTRC